MTLTQFLTIRSGLVTSSILIERDLAKAKNVQETRYIRRMAAKIDAGLRALDSIENERTDLPQPKQQLVFAASTQEGH